MPRSHSAAGTANRWTRPGRLTLRSGSRRAMHSLQSATAWPALPIGLARGLQGLLLCTRLPGAAHWNSMVEQDRLLAFSEAACSNKMWDLRLIHRTQEVVDFLLCLIPLVAVAFLKLAQELVFLAADNLPVIISQFA